MFKSFAGLPTCNGQINNNDKIKKTKNKKTKKGKNKKKEKKRKRNLSKEGEKEFRHGAK